MKLQQLDTTSGAPLAQCLQWLDTLTKSPAVPWEPGQRDAALQALADARALMQADVLALAGRVHTRREPVRVPAAPVLTAAAPSYVIDYDPRFLAAHFQDGRDLKAEAMDRVGEVPDA